MARNTLHAKGYFRPDHERAAKAAALARGTGGLPLFTFTTRQRGVPLDDRRVREVFARILRHAGLPTHHTPHHLRHTFYVLLLSDGVPVTYVMTQAGHSSIDTTVRYYGRWIPKSDRALIDRINAKLAPAQALLAAAGGGSSQDVSSEPGNRKIASNSDGGVLRPSTHAGNFSGSGPRSPALSPSASCRSPKRRQPRNYRWSFPPVNLMPS